MMTKEQIAELICRDKTYRAICRKIARSADLADDLLQHIVLLILEGKAGNIEQVTASGNLRWYFVRLCTNQYQSTSTSTFSRLYKHFEPVMEYLPIEQEINDCSEDMELFEKEYKQVTQYINERGWYHAKLFELYIEIGSIRKLSKQTKISHVSIFKSLKDTKDYVHNRINNTSPASQQLELDINPSCTDNKALRPQTV